MTQEPQTAATGDEHHELRPRYDAQLHEIQVRQVELGTKVLANLRHAGVVVLENRFDEVPAIKAADDPINAEYKALEEMVFEILALQQPVASDLRLLVVSTRILYEIERSGDLVVNIVKNLQRVDGLPSDPVLLTILARLIEASSAMFERGLEALATMDPQIGHLAETEDEETDTITAELFSAVTARQDALGLEVSVALFYIGRFLERIADHGVNIAENVTFAVTSQFPDKQ